MGVGHIKMMVDKLYDEMAYGRIDNDWECQFIENMFNLCKDPKNTFSVKQATKIEELFDKY